MTQYGAGTERKDVGIIGIGGLGHFGLLFAKALGANVTAISHSESKRADAEKMGATRFIATHSGKDKDFEPYKRSLDLIISTTNDVDMPMLGYLSLLRPGGYLVMVGAPEKPIPALPAFPFLMSNVHLAGSAIGSPKIIKDMLAVAAKDKIHSWIIKRDMDDVNSAVVDMNAGKVRCPCLLRFCRKCSFLLTLIYHVQARYRYVLVNKKNGGVM